MGFDTTILEALVLGIIGGAIGYKGKDVFNSMNSNGAAAGAVAETNDEEPRTSWYSKLLKRRSEEMPALEMAEAEMPALEMAEAEMPVADEPAALQAVYQFDGHIHLVSDSEKKQTPALIKIFLSNNPAINPGALMFEIITDSGLTYNIRRHGYTDLSDKTSPSKIPRVHITNMICKIFVQNSDKYRSYTFTINPDVCKPNVMGAFQHELKYNKYQLYTDSNTIPYGPQFQDDGIDLPSRIVEASGGKSRRRKKSSNRRQSRRR